MIQKSADKYRNEAILCMLAAANEISFMRKYAIRVISLWHFLWYFMHGFNQAHILIISTPFSFPSSTTS